MENKVFFAPGDTVTLKQDVPNKPVMIVKSIDKVTIRDREANHSTKPTLFGITCFWFTTAGELQENRFNTKDLIHYVEPGSERNDEWYSEAAGERTI